MCSIFKMMDFNIKNVKNDDFRKTAKNQKFVKFRNTCNMLMDCMLNICMQHLKKYLFCTFNSNIWCKKYGINFLTCHVCDFYTP